MNKLNVAVLVLGKRVVQSRSYFRSRHEIPKNLLSSAETTRVSSSKSEKNIAHLIRTNRLSEARVVFDKMEQRETLTWNSMINGYVKRREMAKARELFDEMPNRDVVSWNLMISGYVLCRGSRFLEEGRRLFDVMPERDCVSWNTMISGYAKNGRMEDALRLFNSMPQKNVVSWNAIVSGFLQNGEVASAIDCFERMPERDCASLSALVSGLIRNGELDEAARVLFKFGNKYNGREDLVYAYNTLIAGYGQRGRIEEARRLFDQIPVSNEGKEGNVMFKRDIVSWNSMIMCYVKVRNIVSARELFDQMMERDTYSWNTIISGYIHVSDMREASNLFGQMPNPDTFSWNAMITGYAQMGNLEVALDFFKRMPRKNLVSWNSMIAGCEENKDYRRAIELFTGMQVEGEKPDRHTLSSVLSVSSGIVDLYLGMQIHQLITKTVIPDLPINNALITMMHNNVELARVAAEALMKLEPESSAPYVLLYNMYADVGRWDEASEVRMLMKSNKIKKPSGYSWIDSSHVSNECEVIAILKLISHTSRNFPRVFLSWECWCCSTCDWLNPALLFGTCILSISTILSKDKEGLPVFRNVNQSQELKVVLCRVCIWIAKTFPHIWRPESRVHTLCSSEPCFPLIDCFQVALSILDPDRVGGRTINDIKCQKVDEGIMVSDANVPVEHKHSPMTPILDCERKEEYADYMQASLLSFVELLDPFPLSSQVLLRPDVAVTVLSMLYIAFSRYPKTNISLCIFRKVPGYVSRQNRDLSFMESFSDSVDPLNVVTEPHSPWKTKCIAVQVASKLGQNLTTESVLEVLDLALLDESEQVGIEAVLSSPVIVLWSGLGVRTHVQEAKVSCLNNFNNSERLDLSFNNLSSVKRVSSLCLNSVGICINCVHF
ncbi:hypothetical protein Q3G72_014178 [Acer saccharum]|nr:hypothetical protein Q3G72_014178 [Acer saccharum]